MDINGSFNIKAHLVSKPI